MLFGEDVDVAQKAQELLMAVTMLTLGHDFAGGDIEAANSVVVRWCT